MFYFFEFIEGRSADALGGRIDGNIVVLFFKLFQLFEKPVILLIGNNRRIQDIIAVIVLVDLGDELFDFFLDVGGDGFHRMFMYGRRSAFLDSISCELCSET